ncbi:MAG: 23S rRNA (uridine(2552)-2'-O)-methyltransferase [Thermoplasmata archaeon]|nr:MAG: 23S rRNA (uridine(2552)-2'-O)-methyltransferase [Thermoplasmata archaeon]
MRSRWIRDRKRDYYYRLAKAEGYRSRAAYKLIQINKKFGVIKRGNAVIDLGCSPGGWSQVASMLVGKAGMVIGVDIQGMLQIPGVRFIRGDAECDDTLEKIAAVLAEEGRDSVDVVLSDMSPRISGHYDYDHANSIYLARIAHRIAKRFLKRNGNLVIKVFDGDMLQDFLKDLRGDFSKVDIYRPKASRKSSSEVYIICRGFSPKGR